MRSVLLLQSVDVKDGEAGVGIGIFYIDDTVELLFLLLYFSGYGVTSEVSVSFLAVFASGRQQVSPAVAFPSGLLLLAVAADSFSGRLGRWWRIRLLFLVDPVQGCSGSHGSWRVWVVDQGSLTADVLLPRI